MSNLTQQGARSIADRAKEPSTHAGVAALVLTLQHFLPPHWQPVATAAAGVFGSLAVALRERGGSSAAR